MYTKREKSDPRENIQPFGKIHCKNIYCCPGEWWRNVAGGGHGRTDRALAEGEDEKRAKEQNACWIFPKKRQSFSPSSINYTLQFSGTFPHLVTCQPTDGRADWVALTLTFPAVFQNFSAADLHNLIHQLFVCKHVYLRLRGQGEPTKTPSYLCLEDSWS